MEIKSKKLATNSFTAITKTLLKNGKKAKYKRVYIVYFYNWLGSVCIM